ncbi:T9SS type A sorting domain-containing protein [Dinghuibacter silviterrae]|uniref:Putative secreted protein (Por secretion system target) n=1 Tax=Dinghuibacter silviterrae TaxID=1539049 RepID=A0A4R8DG67_9BACT|nr:T9SS type A sorting domain-containing protein [Dinghuibacter silviterrae]TDW96244.1 putative secreted protein (Por secretion system target) [Dinghuibacter silviterrae]
MKTLIRITLLTSYALYGTGVSAQSYYPGGLGNANLILWLNASKSSSITMSSNQVSQWNDLSGNGYNFTQGTSGNQPVYSATAGNGNRPAVTFTSTSSQYLSTPTLPASLSFTKGLSTFTMATYNAPQTPQGWQRIFDFGNGQQNNNFMTGRYGSTNQVYAEGWNGGTGDQTWTTTTPIVNGTANMFETVQAAGAASTTTAVTFYIAGTSQASSGAAGSVTYIPKSIARASNFIGRSNWNVDNYFSGNISELIILDTAVSTTEQIILENYMWAGWGKAVANTKYTMTGTTYGTNLVGIGYTSLADNFLANPAGSTDGLGLSSASTGFLSSAGYLMAAHNGQANTVITNATIPGFSSTSSISKWNRSWYVQHTGGNTAATANLNFTFPDYNGTTPGAANYYLLYNANDGSFATGTNQIVTTNTTSVSGTTVSFNVTVSNLAAGYYTIIYSTTPITLPVTLISFTGQKDNTASLLQWTTAGKDGTGDFVIERSTDGQHFDSLALVTNPLDISTEYSYQYKDQTPFAGRNYYRLKMIDPFGDVSYSNIVLVGFDSENKTGITCYPNPVQDVLHVSLPVASEVTVRIFDLRGREVGVYKDDNTNQLSLPVQTLSTGMYVATIEQDGERYTQKVVKH